MLTASDVLRYGIVLNTDIYSVVDYLFSGERSVRIVYDDLGREHEIEYNLDPIEEAHKVAGEYGFEHYDINIAICQNNACIVQVLVFRSKDGYDLYKKDGKVIFDHKER